MGLFSKLRGAGAPATGTRDRDIARSVIAMPLLMANADGQISETELVQIQSLCMFSPIFQAIGMEATRELILENLTVMKSQGAEGLFASVLGTLSPKLRETAMCFAIRTALADGHLAEGEQRMLIAMAERMGIPPETFGRMIEVLGMLQRGPAA